MTDRLRLNRIAPHRGKLAIAALFVATAIAMIPKGTAAQSPQRPLQSADRGSAPVQGEPADRGPLVGPKFEAQPAAKQSGLPVDVEQMLSPSGLSSTLKIMLVLTVISLAPAILIMTTCFMRFVIVFSLLRQALGTQQLPPNQVLMSLSLFLTFLVMSPVWKEAYEQGIRPYSNPQGGRSTDRARRGFSPNGPPVAALHDRTNPADR